MATFEDVLIKQHQLRSATSRALPNYKKLGQAKMTFAVTKSRMERLTEHFAEARDLDAKLHILADEKTFAAHPYFKEQLFIQCETMYDESIDHLSEALHKVTPALIPSRNQGTVSDSGSRPTSRLPRIELPTFDGSLLHWETFRDRFKSMIIDDASLSNVERMHYLCSVLSGDASNALNHLSVSETNFAVAWQIISSRYENKRRLISAHLQTLCSLPPLANETAKSLQSLRDKTNASIQALKNLGRPVESWDDILVFLVTQKLDKASRKAWELKMSDTTEFPSYSELDKFLEARIRALEAILPAKAMDTAESFNSKSATRSRGIPSHSATAVKFACAVCKKPHPLYQCVQFLSYTPARRHEFIKSQRRCFNCLAANHSLSNCKNEHRCRECQQKHHTLLHLPETIKAPSGGPSTSIAPTKSETKSEVVSLSMANNPCSRTTVLLATARVRVHSSRGRCTLARALLDQGSAATLVSERVAQVLRLPRIKQYTRLTGIGNTQSSARYAAELKISSAANDEPAYSTSAVILPSLTKYAPPQITTVTTWPHLTNLPLADNEPMSSDPIDLIIGADLYCSLLRDGLRRGGDPVAQNTALGWILSGPIAISPNTTLTCTHHSALKSDLDLTLRRFWELESLPDRTVSLPEDQKCEEHFRTTHSRTKDGRYVVRLPFRRGSPSDLGESRHAALVNLHRLEHRLQRDSEKATAYSDFLEEYKTLGHMAKVPPSEHSSQIHYYIPHHAVIRESSDTTRLRVVFNASSPSSSGQSLNDLLFVGPKLQTDLSAVRQFRYVLSADIAKMYRQILVDSRDVDYQRILWRSSTADPVDEYRLLTVTYGTASAPFLALRVLKQLAIDEESQFPLALPVLQDQLYVDDCTFGADDLHSALQIRDQLTALLKRGGFRLRKWASNCPALLADMDPSDHGLAISKDLSHDDAIKILGVSWQPESDIFKFNVTVSNNVTITKRGILSTIARLFDPLGWVSPVIIVAKIFVQRLWSQKCDWDDEIPPDLLADWSRFHSQLPSLESLIIPRWIQIANDNAHAELHGFADASSKAYAAAVYLRVVGPDGQISISLLAAKSKVAPIKTTIISRLELCAALLLARLLVFIRSTCQSLCLDCRCWTDSTVVIAWLSQTPARWKTFVAHRVAEIQALLPNMSWHYVPTHENPADCASRGIYPSSIHTHALWWHGPGWLELVANEWPDPPVPVLVAAPPDERPALLCCPAEPPVDWDLSSRFSSWSTLLRVTAYVMRFVRLLRQKGSPDGRRPMASHTSPSIALTAAEIRSAEIFWINHMQAKTFPLEFKTLTQNKPIKKSSSLAALSPYADNDGLIRVRGRLTRSSLPEDARRPIIIKSHPLVTLLISDIHEKAFHSGPRLTLSLLRQRFWLLRARATVRAVLYRCVACTREQARIPDQLMGDLPDFRVNASARAFLHTGVDYAGPVLVRTASGRGHKANKAYIALFVCMTTKALHLELVSNYSSAAFLAAYNRFSARRGRPASLYSDNGTTFQGADREMTASFRQATSRTEFINYLAIDGVTWHFMPPLAPHFGGLWEAAVRSVKHHIKRTIGSHTLIFEEFTTLLCRIKACLNSRPIAAVSDSLENYTALTPGHFLIGSEIVASPEPSLLSLAEQRLSRWQLLQQLSEKIWKSWSADYLHTLQQRPKWQSRQRLAQPGQLVLLRDPNAPPSRWKLGRIVKCHPGEDKLVRVVSVRTADTEYKRPITKLCFLPVNINLDTEHDSATAGGNLI